MQRAIPRPLNSRLVRYPKIEPNLWFDVEMTHFPQSGSATPEMLTATPAFSAGEPTATAVASNALLAICSPFALAIASASLEVATGRSTTKNGRPLTFSARPVAVSASSAFVAFGIAVPTISSLLAGSQPWTLTSVTCPDGAHPAVERKQFRPKTSLVGSSVT